MISLIKDAAYLSSPKTEYLDQQIPRHQVLAYLTQVSHSYRTGY